MILLAVMAAPSAGNQQLYTIIDITDQSLLEKLAISCDDQPFIATAPTALIFCADQQKWYDAFQAGGCLPREPGPGDLMLHLPDFVFPAVMLVFGYPTPQQLAHPKPARSALKYIVHENQYRRMDKSELSDMLRQDRDDWHFDAWIQAFCWHKYNSDFSVQMSRSAAKYLKAFDMDGHKP